MKRMFVVVIVMAVLIGGGLWAYARTRTSKPEARKSPAVQTARPRDESPSSVKEFPGDSPEKRALLRRLRREERRQRPQEGRN